MTFLAKRSILKTPSLKETRDKSMEKIPMEQTKLMNERDVWNEGEETTFLRKILAPQKDCENYKRDSGQLSLR